MMTELFYSERTHDGGWICGAVLEISAHKTNLINKDLTELLLEFQDQGCSYEVIFEHGDDGKVQCILLIRKKGIDLIGLQDSFSVLIQNITERLEYEGCHVECKCIQKADDIISSFERRRHVYLCVPGAETADFKLCYVPGGYMKTDKLDLEYFMTILGKSKNAGISFQISSTELLDIEKQRISENMDWLWNAYGNTPEGQYAIDSYKSYFDMAGQKLYFICISYWGDAECVAKLSYYISHRGYRLLEIPLEQLYKRNYLIEGIDIIASYCAEARHILYNDMAVPQGCERLDYIVSPFYVDGIVGVSEISGDKRHAYKDIAEIPECFLNSEGIELGEVIDGGEHVYLPMEQLARHMTIAGMSGSGKTTLLFKILIECNSKSIPFLVIEPTKTEYRELIDVIPNLRVFTPGRTNVSPIMFNPFLPPENITLEQYLPSLISAFQLAFSMTTPLDVIFAEAVRNCYASYGWRNDSTRNSKGITQFGIHEFICAFKEEIYNSSYDYESKQNLNSGGVYRLQSLINNNPYLFDTDKTMDFGELLNGSTLIELDAIDNYEQKALLISLLLLQLKLVIRHTQVKDSKLKNVILIDEAHVLLDNVEKAYEKNEVDAGGRIENYLLDMVKVNRVYGTGMIFADQSLSILRSFVNNSNIKVAMHLESYEEREFLTNNLNLSEEMYNKIANLEVGQFYISCEKLGQPLLIRMKDVRKNYEIPYDVSDEYVVERMKAVYEMPFLSCACDKCCDISIRNEAEFIARNACNKVVSSVYIAGNIDEKTEKQIDKIVSDMVAGCDNERKLYCCARMMTERMARRKAALAEQEIR